MYLQKVQWKKDSEPKSVVIRKSENEKVNGLSKQYEREHKRKTR